MMSVSFLSSTCRAPTIQGVHLRARIRRRRRLTQDRARRRHLSERYNNVVGKILAEHLDELHVICSGKAPARCLTCMGQRSGMLALQQACWHCGQSDQAGGRLTLASQHGVGGRKIVQKRLPVSARQAYIPVRPRYSSPALQRVAKVIRHELQRLVRPGCCSHASAHARTVCGCSAGHRMSAQRAQACACALLPDGRPPPPPSPPPSPTPPSAGVPAAAWRTPVFEQQCHDVLHVRCHAVPALTGCRAPSEPRHTRGRAPAHTVPLEVFFRWQSQRLGTRDCARHFGGLRLALRHGGAMSRGLPKTVPGICSRNKRESLRARYSLSHSLLLYQFVVNF